MTSKDLTKAKSSKSDEFYTQYEDIEKEIDVYFEYNPNTFRDKVILLPCDDPDWSNFTLFFVQNFKKLGIKKLVSTSYAADKPRKILTVIRNPIDESVSWNYDYLKGNGDFRSVELKKLLDESDIVITNPPFSLFREFVAWVVGANKSFLLLGNMNAISYKEIFPLIKSNKLWLGATISSGIVSFECQKTIQSWHQVGELMKKEMYI